MRFLCALACVVLLNSLGICSVWAHHVSEHGRVSTISFNPYSSQLRPPTTFLGFNFNFDHLDGDLGHVLTYQFVGEYAITPKMGVGGRIPVLSIHEKFLPEADGLGDIALSIKRLVGQWPVSRIFLNLGTEISFPTGNDAKGTGSGDVLFSPYLTFSKGFCPFSVLLSLGSTLAASDQVRPSLDYGASVIVPLVKEKLPIDFSLSLQSSTLTTSNIFVSGSTKTYLKPAVVFHLTPKFLTTLGAKISVVDTLEIKPGVVLSQQSTAPLSDMDAGFLFDMNYSFP